MYVWHVGSETNVGGDSPSPRASLLHRNPVMVRDIRDVTWAELER